jgi:hypothetical protein
MCAINVGCAAGVPSRLKAARNALPFKLAPHGIPLNWIYEGKVATPRPAHSRKNSGIAAQAGEAMSAPRASLASAQERARSESGEQAGRGGCGKLRKIAMRSCRVFTSWACDTI